MFRLTNFQISKIQRFQYHLVFLNYNKVVEVLSKVVLYHY